VRGHEALRVYAARSEVRHFSDFAREHLIQSEDRWERKPLNLEPRAILLETALFERGVRHDVEVPGTS
jgi:hypothetical protein